LKWEFIVYKAYRTIRSNARAAIPTSPPAYPSLSTRASRSGRDQAGDDDAAELDHQALHRFESIAELLVPAPEALVQSFEALLNPIEALVDPIEALVDGVEALVDRIEAKVDVLGELVQPLVRPALSHEVHDARTLRQHVSRVAR
jgi:hypothetical protein